MSSFVGDLRCSGSLTGSFLCSWTLKNFSRLCSSPGKGYKSRSFPSEDNNNINWYLWIYPGGIKAEHNACVSCFLHCCNAPDDGIKIRRTMTFKNIEGKSLCSYTLCSVIFPGTGRGFNEVISRTVLLEELPRDVLVIVVEGIYSLSTIKLNDQTHHIQDTSPFVKLADDLFKLSESSRGSDAVISVGDIRIPVHKAVITARSKVFAAMFQHGTAESDSGNILISDFAPDVVKALLQFVYCGNVDMMDVALAQELLRAADKYDLEDLKSYSSHFLIAHLNEDNVLQLLICADSFNAGKLRQKSIDYFCKAKKSFEFEKYQSSLKRVGTNLLWDIIKRMKEL